MQQAKSKCSHCVPPNDVKVSAIHKLLAYKTAPNKVIALFSVEFQTRAVLDKNFELLLADQTERTSDSLNEGLSIKMIREKIQRKISKK